MKYKDVIEASQFVVRYLAEKDKEEVFSGRYDDLEIDIEMAVNEAICLALEEYDIEVEE